MLDIGPELVHCIDFPNTEFRCLLYNLVPRHRTASHTVVNLLNRCVISWHHNLGYCAHPPQLLIRVIQKLLLPLIILITLKIIYVVVERW